MVKRFSTVRDTQRGSQSYMEKRRGKKEIEVTRRSRGGVKRGETILASNQLPKCFLQPRTPKEIHRFMGCMDLFILEAFPMITEEREKACRTVAAMKALPCRGHVPPAMS